MLINHLLRIINTQNPIRHRFCTKYVRIIHLRSMFKRKNSVFHLPFLPPPPPPPTGGREKGKEKLDFAARTLSFKKQYLHRSHQICVEKYYCTASLYSHHCEVPVYSFFCSLLCWFLIIGRLLTCSRMSSRTIIMFLMWTKHSDNCCLCAKIVAKWKINSSPS
jgi:hypothetical protein